MPVVKLLNIDKMNTLHLRVANAESFPLVNGLCTNQLHDLGPGFNPTCGSGPCMCASLPLVNKILKHLCSVCSVKSVDSACILFPRGIFRKLVSVKAVCVRQKRRSSTHIRATSTSCYYDKVPCIRQDSPTGRELVEKFVTSFPLKIMALRE